MPLPRTSMDKIMKGVDEAAIAAAKGPEDRILELQKARAETISEIKSGIDKKKGYDGEARLQSIDHEIRRLTPPPGGFKQPKAGEKF